MVHPLTFGDVAFRSIARTLATRWLLPLGIPGLLSSVELAADGLPPAHAGGGRSPAFARSSPTVRLPAPHIAGPILLEETLRKRRSVRVFTPESLSIAEVSDLLWAGQGITDGNSGRSAPSAGALYPLDLFLVAGKVRGLDPGVYRYQPATHELTRTATRDRRGPLCSAALHQDCVRSAPAAVVITGTFERTTRKYGDRGVRYVHMEAGCAAENISLAATGIGLGTVIVGAFEDRQVRKALDLPASAEPLCILPVGRPGGEQPE